MVRVPTAVAVVMWPSWGNENFALAVLAPTMSCAVTTPLTDAWAFMMPLMAPDAS